MEDKCKKKWIYYFPHSRWDPRADHSLLWEHSQSKEHLIWALTKIFSPFNCISMAVSHRQPALAASLRWMKGQGLGLIRQKKITSLFSPALWSLAFCLIIFLTILLLPTGALRVSLTSYVLSKNEQERDSEYYTYSLQGKVQYQPLQPLASVLLQNLYWQLSVLVKGLPMLREEWVIILNWSSGLEILIYDNFRSTNVLRVLETQL